MKSSTSSLSPKGPYLHRRQLWLLAVTVAVVVLVFRHFAEGQRVVAVIRSANPIWVVVALGLQLATYAAAAALFRNLTAAFGYVVALRRLYRISVAIVFLNSAFPAAGASGATFLAKTLKADGIPVSRSVLLSTLYYIFNWLSFFSLLAVAYLYLLITRPLTSTEHALGASALLMGVALMFVVVALGRSERRFVTVVRFTSGLVRRVSRWFRKPGPDIEIVAEHAKVFHEGFRSVLSHRSTFGRAAVSSALEHALDIVTLAAVFLAFRTPVNLGVLTVGFFLANLLAWLSFVPTGLGIFEGSLVGILTAFGVPFEAAAVSVLVYRALSFWLPIPLGFALYRSLLRDARTLQSVPEPVG